MNIPRDQITKTAEELLHLHPQPVPHFRLLRDVLQAPTNSAGYRAAQESVSRHPHVLELYETQEENGTWGRFHTQDSAIKKRFVTSECAIERALALGLDLESPLLRRTVGFLTAHIAGQAAWSDPPEKHDNPQLFPYFTRLVSAANLALIDTRHPMLDEPRGIVVEMLKIAFRSGAYRAEDEITARTEVTGIVSKTSGSFLLCKYGLLLLSSTGRALPQELEDCLLDYVFHRPNGVYYMYDHNLSNYLPIDSPKFAGWLATHDLLSRFPGWKRHGEQVIEWIWSQRNADGFWDFGSRAYKGYYFPLSTDWRRKEDRVIDCTVRVLALLNRLYLE